jgi:hypothetical protein
MAPLGHDRRSGASTPSTGFFKSQVAAISGARGMRGNCCLSRSRPADPLDFIDRLPILKRFAATLHDFCDLVNHFPIIQ